MKIKRFFAKDMRAALSQVKEELGADAVIMSNKKVNGGVEIVAAVDAEAPSLSSPASSSNRQGLAESLGQAKRKLADDKVQLQQSGGRFANVLNRFARNDSADAGTEAESEADSLSALLKRQSQHRDQPARHQEMSRLADHHGQERGNERQSRGYEPRDSRYDDHEGWAGKPQQPSRQGYNSPRSQRGSHGTDSGDYRYSSAQPEMNSRYDEYSASAAAETSRGSQFGGNRLDPSRYDANSASQNFDEIASMRHELVSLRRLLEHQVSGLMWQEVERREPMRAMMIKRLEKMGLSPELADQLACYIPEDVPANEAWPALLDLLADQLVISDDSILKLGGVVALLGPTGVGKTTTIAKLAARAAMEFGPEQIALVTTDTFRIGAHEQLATYGRIMGCPVRVAKDAEELADILHQLRHRRLILLDTAGMGQRDIRLSVQLDTLMQNSGSKIRSFLVLPATAQRRVLQETIEHFRRIPLSGCVLTKLDESLSLGEVICAAIQHALPVAYLADGQRVPEDIKVATGNYLVARANELLEQELSEQSHFWASDSSDDQAADFYD
ncbi:flagellar biosynthesis regulator FlhF [Photobacterium aquae]|uniref:Flagellar biosynthesis protein FlhF n=1 Tax=Photobacterium aquae TaxID=1195763 RepID=A0A0J1H231_9GAMM|nr:flagellar biosynthesis protein FlhF [Photobacterium aquae]KLV05860.1 flagellar biosynthesis regulator FlhF [Photobacterium aquae]